MVGSIIGQGGIKMVSASTPLHNVNLLYELQVIFFIGKTMMLMTMKSKCQNKVTTKHIIVSGLYSVSLAPYTPNVPMSFCHNFI